MKSNKMWNMIQDAMKLSSKPISKALIDSELWPRIVPINILKWFLGKVATNITFDKRCLVVFF